MNAIIIQSPLVQLNAPYPSGAYLSSFFKSQGLFTKWLDFSNEMFYQIFSKEGLSYIFEATEKTACKMADDAEKNGDENTAFNLRRYVSTKDYWIKWIDFIVASLCDGNKIYSTRELFHQFLYSPFAPRGNRMEQYLSNIEKEATIDDIEFLCSYAIADIADYITAVFDKNFSLIRYAESVTMEGKSFEQILSQLKSPILDYFYKKILQNHLAEFEKIVDSSKEKTLICLTVPFAGVFIPALYAADFFKKKFGEKVFVVMGGGFINTEFREVTEKGLAKFIDAISYDRGYGSYLDLLKSGLLQNQKSKNSLYKIKLFLPETVEPVWNDVDLQKKEDELTQNITPDYDDIDFAKYPRLCDDLNPMHRLWSDGTWIKAYLAHGCYWHKCAFCDVNLDYVCGYKQTNTKNLFDSLYKTSQKKGVRGIHFVDEALPPSQLVEFGKLNVKCENPLYFWGNVRFEKTFSYDIASFLSYAGLGGVSAGIEVATSKGLANIHKGTDLDSIVSACAAFKENGILVHSYMIYGFWNETEQDLINSMETLRQFFEEGLLDSAFWHKFVLTRNSRIYSEWKESLHPDLIPIENKTKQFIEPALHFKGENKSEKYGQSLEIALNNWMHSNHLEKKVTKWFDFPVCAPTIPKDFIAKAIERYENRKQKEFNKPILEFKNIFWLGSNPLVYEVNGQKIISWFYLQEQVEIPLNKKEATEIDELICLVKSFVPKSSQENPKEKADSIKKWQSLLLRFRGKGLCCF